MFKIAAILYLICFGCYILFSRQPDYFDNYFTKGTVVLSSTGSKKVEYSIDNINYTRSIESWGDLQFKKGQQVPVIYNPSNPKDASLYSFFSYWLKLPELLVSSAGFIILLFAAIIITGKEEPYYYTEDEKRKKRKYDD